MILRWWVLWSALFLLQGQGRHNDGKISNREEHSYSASYPVSYSVSTSHYGIATSTTHGYEGSVTLSTSKSVNPTSLNHTQSKVTSSGRSSSTHRSSVTVSGLPSGVSSTMDTSMASSPRTTDTTKHTSKTSRSPTTGTVSKSKGSSTSNSGRSSMSSDLSGSSSGASVTRPTSSSKSSAASQSVSSNRGSSTKTDTSDPATSSKIATTHPLTSSGSKSGAPSLSSDSKSSMSGSLTTSKQPTVTTSIPTTGMTDSHTLKSTTRHSASNSTTPAPESSSTGLPSVSQSQPLKTSSVLSTPVSNSTSSRNSSHTLSLTDTTSRETASRTVSSAKSGSTSIVSSSEGSSGTSSSVVSSSKGTSTTSSPNVSSLLGTSTKTTQSKESSADSASSQGSLTLPDSSSSKGSSAPSSSGSSSQVNSSKGSSSKSGDVATQSAPSTIITTAKPGHSASTITAPPTSAFTSTVSNAPSSTSTSTSIIDLLQDEIDHQVDDLKHFIVLVGAWIKVPSPNPPEVIAPVDKISSGLNTLKPKLPQPPVNDPGCGTGKGKLQKRFWPFDGIKDVVNAVQAVAKVATKVSKIRTQLVKGAIEGIQSELLDVGKITDALDIYDVAKDPCNAPQTTSSGIGATTSKSTASKKTTSSSSACSTRTISNCDVVCTSTTTSGAGVNSEPAANGCTTTCGSPTVTCGKGTTSTSTTTTTILPPLVCAPTCCGLVPSGSPSPMPLVSTSEDRGIQKRAPLPSPHGPPFNGIFNFMKDMCNTYSTLVQVVDNSGKITLSYQTRLDQRKSICMGWLTGCTAVVVMSNNYLWMAHIFESPTILQPNRWKEEVFDAFENGGHGSNIPDAQSLRNLVRFGGPFGPGTRTRAYLVAPLARRDTANHPQSNQWLYPQFVGQLQYFMERMIGNDVHLLPYMATADLEWGITNVPPTDPEHRPRWTDALLPFRTPYGKVLINFDPNKNNVPNGCWGKAGWEIWVSDGPAAVASDEWDAYNYPQPGKRAETTAPACALPSTFSTRSSSIGGTSRSSAKSTASKSSATSQGSVSHVSTVSTTKSSLTRSTISSSSRPTSTAPPDISVPASGDGDCNGCGKWWKACESDWCPKVNLSGKDCSDKCFVHACFADSAPSECRPDGRCHSVTCPDSPKEPRKTVHDPSPIKVDCTDDTGCDCCFDFTAACFKNWIPEGTPKIRAYDFCYSEMCYDGPKKCLKGGNGCEFSKDCPKKKGEPKEGGWPGTPPKAIFNQDEIEDMVSYEYGLLSQNVTVAV